MNLTTLFAGVFQVKWMMYWIVFALFSFIEVFADILISWQVATCYLYLPLKLLWDALSFKVKNVIEVVVWSLSTACAGVDHRQPVSDIIHVHNCTAGSSCQARRGLPSHRQSIAPFCLIPVYTAWWQMLLCVNNLLNVIWSRMVESSTHDFQIASSRTQPLHY